MIGPGALLTFLQGIKPAPFAVALLFFMAWTVHEGFAQETDGLSAAITLEHSLTQLIEQTEPSVVSVARIRPVPGLTVESRFLQAGQNASPAEPRDLLPNQFAGGVLIAPEEGDERFVLTVYHAVRGGPEHGVAGSGDGSTLEIRFPSRHVCPATIIAADPRSDLAVLKLDLRGTNLRFTDLRPISWRETAPARKGQLVITLGNPYWIARDGSPSAGWAMIANLGRRPAALTPTPSGLSTLGGLGGLIHLDTRLPLGSSGSPVVNLTGQLVGITTSLAAVEGYERSSGFALPVDASTRWIIEDLLAGYEVEYGFLGVEPRTIRPLPPELTSQPSAAIVHNVHKMSPGHAGGLRPGDVILQVDGQPTYSDLDLMRQVTLHPPESVARLQILRGGREALTLSVKLGKWPASEDEKIIATARRWPLWRGLGVDYSTGRMKFAVSGQFVIRTGVLIRDVLPGSPAETALLEPGEFIARVNGKSVSNPREFQTAVSETSGKVNLQIVAADDTTRSVTIEESAAE